MTSMLNAWSNTKVLSSMSLQDLVNQVASIDAPVSDCQFLVQGQIFYCVFRCNSRIVKVKKPTVEIVQQTKEG